MKIVKQPGINTTKKIEQYQEEIRDRNCKGFQSFTSGGMLITGFILLAGVIMHGYVRFIFEYAAFFSYMIVIYYLSVYCNKHKVKQIILIFYAALLPVYIGCILLGSFLDPDRPAITIMVLLYGPTIFIIDKPIRMFLYLFGISIAFSVCSWICKTPELFQTDMINLIIYFSIGIGISMYSLKARVESVENFICAREKSELDVLTSLLNRGAGERQVKNLLRKKSGGSFMIMDIDEFKKINDTYGHQTGDEVICKIAETLQNTFRPTDIVWRLGGDEFAVFAVGMMERSLCEERIQLLIQKVSEIQISESVNARVSISVGCTIIGQNKIWDFENLYRNSDRALYKVKETNKGGFLIV